MKYTDAKKLNVLKDAIISLEGVEIPFNIIKTCIIPLREYVEGELNKIK